MRFKRCERYERFVWTKRKLTFASNRRTREIAKIEDRYPLLSTQIEPFTPAFDADVEARTRSLRIQSSEARMRSLYARVWRESRRDFFNATPEQMQAIREGWLAWTGPATCMYFRYVVDLHTGVMAQRSAALKNQREQWKLEIDNTPQTLELQF